MLEAILITIFIIAFALVWYVVLYLLKHPNLDFDLEARVLAHEPDLEDKLTKIRLYLHEEEYASIREIELLLNTPESQALELISLLVKRQMVEFYQDNATQEVWIRLI